MKTLAALLIALIVLAACESTNESTSTPPAPTVVIESSPTPDEDDTTAAPTVVTESPPTASADDATTAPTFQPTEQLMIPADLDRQLEDTSAMQAQRTRLVENQVKAQVTDQGVINAMMNVPRHSFVPTDHLAQAYNDHPLPIGYGQTISQPSLVARMTELLELQEGDKVLEIGTGSGYQAAILGELTQEVYTVEIIPELAGTARAILDELGYEYIHVDRRDGYFGWQEHAPFDAIIVTAAPDHLPQPLVRQLNPDGGRMVIPIGPVGNVQVLWLVTRNGEEVNMERLLPVQFVPFTREDD